MSRRLEGAVAVVTGGAKGLGAGLVRAYVAEGAQVIAFDRDAEALQTLSEGLDGPVDERVLTVAGDVTSPDDNESVVAQAVAAFGKIDVWVANAGVWDFKSTIDNTPLHELSRMVDDVLSVNVKGVLLGVAAAVHQLRKNSGRVIVTLSQAALYAGGGGPAYVSSKHAALGLVRQLAQDLAPDVRVNAVAPTAMPTSLSGPASLGLTDRSFVNEWDEAAFVKMAPLGFSPSIQDYVGPYVLLASREESRTMTGSVLACDLGLGIRPLPAPTS